MKQFQYSATSGVLKFIEAEKTLSYEEGKKSNVIDVYTLDAGYQKGYEEGQVSASRDYYGKAEKEGFKAGIHAAIAEAEGMMKQDDSTEEYRAFNTALNLQVIRLKALLPDNHAA